MPWHEIDLLWMLGYSWNTKIKPIVETTIKPIFVSESMIS